MFSFIARLHSRRDVSLDIPRRVFTFLKHIFSEASLFINVKINWKWNYTHNRNICPRSINKICIRIQSTNSHEMLLSLHCLSDLSNVIDWHSSNAWHIGPLQTSSPVQHCRNIGYTQTLCMCVTVLSPSLLFTCIQNMLDTYTISNMYTFVLCYPYKYNVIHMR